MIARGFILQASYRVESRPSRGRRPVVHVYGRLADGGTFLVRDDRQHPHFYIRAADAERAQRLGALEARVVDRRTFDGAAVLLVTTETPGDVPAVRDRLHSAGLETFEADVRFAVRYLIERGIKGGCEIEGDAVAGDPAVGQHLSWVFDNPLIRPAQVDVEPRVLSFDIETDPKGERLLAISLYAPGLDEVLIVDGTARAMPEKATRCADERSALQAFCDRVIALDPDVLTGWNTIDFDFAVLERVAARTRHPLNLGRDAFVRMVDYSLDAVARSVLGEGKAVKGDARDRIQEIQHNYRHDLPAFALYARTDARLAYDIVQKLDLVRLAFARSQLAGMTPDRVAASIASFDFVYLSELEKRGIVAPTVRSSDSAVHAAQQGGHVLESASGLHRNVWVFDFKSLYPSLIRTFNIDPL